MTQTHKLNGNGKNGYGNGEMDTLRFRTIYADPPWQFMNRTGKMAPEHRRLHRYPTMTMEEICALPIANLAAEHAHLYLWVPNALLGWGLRVMHEWGFTYKTNIVWYKVRKDGGPDGRGVGFYFRNVTELLLFGTKGHYRTLAPGRRMVNIVVSQKREHSRKPDEVYEVIEQCSEGPYLELFARHWRPGWTQWGNEVPANGFKLYGDLPHCNGFVKEPFSLKYSNGRNRRRPATLNARIQRVHSYSAR